MKQPDNTGAAPSIAVVGMAGRFPGARNLTEFWRNLRDGIESISPLSEDQLLAAGVTAAELGNPDYVRAAAVLDDIDRFDASFFGLSPRDAAIMDPQHRHFLECAWEALENAGWSVDEFEGRVGVYAGSGMNSYLIHNLLANAELVASAGLFLLKQTGNDKDVLASRVSYQLNLTGPSLAVQTACSTSMVAIHLACQSLLGHECDMALAGGVTIEIPHGLGYIYKEGEILSRDGHCRAFDAASSGTIFGSGLGIVVLRRLEDALHDGDYIHAVIRGTAINNDGARKVGYLAPSVAGQAEAIAEALTVADTEADSISHVETHGTGTTVGDPIEIAALTRAFRTSTERNGFCAIGSLKTNIGHLDAAAGVAGFLKTVLALEHRQLPPSLNFSKPNPLIDFEHSPFYVNTKLREWESEGKPRRAGVTSLGIGGTNAHAILEEAPDAVPSGPSRRWQVLTLSAKTAPALDAMAGDLANHLDEHGPNLADAAFTGHLGRKAFRLRRAIVCKDSADAVNALRRSDPKRIISNSARDNDSPVIFLCSGQGSQYVSMGRGLYESEPEFSATIDFCADYLIPLIGVDLRTILFPSETASAEANELLNQTRVTQPALFVIEYATAKLWSSWGVKPAAMIGHSIGELAAACIAGVFSLEAGLRIVAERARLMQSLPAGSMTAVPLSESQIVPLLNGKLSLASVNSADQCVISGPDTALEKLEKFLTHKGMEFHRLRVSHAFHSSMMEPILSDFAEFVRKFDLSPPRIPFVSSATGTWITGDEATDPNYWAAQLRQTVRFSDGIGEVLKVPDAMLVEIGPGNTLSALCEQHREYSPAKEVISSLRTRRDNTSDEEFMARALAHAWAAGVKIDWKRFHAHERRRRLPLPAYPFQRERFWIEPGTVVGISNPSTKSAKEVREIGFFRPSWIRADVPEKARSRNAGPWLIFEDSLGLGAKIAQLMRRRGERSIAVQIGPSFKQLTADRFEIDPDSPADYQRLLSEITAQGDFPRTIVYAWTVCDPGLGQESLDDLSVSETLSFYSLLFLSQALAAVDLEGQVEIAAVSNSLHQVGEEAILRPSRALLAGPCGVVPKELSNLRCRNIDVEIPASAITEGDDHIVKQAAEQIVAELQTDAIDSPVTYRKNRRWVQTFAKLREPEKPPTIALRDQGVYLISGGLGGIGLVLAESIAKAVRARLVLVGRSAFPSRESWDEWLETHGAHDSIAQQIRSIRAIEHAGAEVMVATADVCDAGAMQLVAAQVRTRFGRVDGIIHAAGVLDDAPLLQKDRANASRVLAPKVRGTLVLESVFQQDPVDFFILMSSVSSQLAPAGQLDYTAANAFLDTFAKSRRPGSPAFISIQWPRWTDVGMAAAEFRGQHDARAVHPLLGHAKHEGEGRTTYSTTLSLEHDWIVNEHRLSGGTGLFPATGYLEMARAAVKNLTGFSALTISDFYINQPLRVATHRNQPVRFLVRKESEGYRFSARTQTDPSGRWIECASGEVTLAAVSSQPSHFDLESLRRGCSAGKLGLERSTRNEAQERHIEFGPRWRNLKTVWLGRDEALSLLELPGEFAAEADVYQLHPALLDMATGSAMFLIEGNEAAGYLYVPISYGSVVISGPLPSTCYAYVRSKSGASIESPIATFDVSILNREGNVIIEIRDFSVRQIHDRSLLDNPNRSLGTEPTNLQHLKEIQESETTQALDAISSEEGGRAFRHLLASARVPNVIVFPSDLSAYVDGLKPRSTVMNPAGHVAVSSNSNEEVEVTLTRWWKELLGVDNVGIQDDFFDLGGQSLTATRLLAKIKKTYKVDLKLSTFFESPTVEKLGQIVRGHDTAAAVSSLVQIRPQGSTPPLFLLHAVDGRTLFFRKLIGHLDSRQRIYAIEYAVNESMPIQLHLEDLAARYIEEIRKVQARGPYYLLGYSFGGLLAFEIAQQLRASGQQVGLLGMLDTVLWSSSTAPQRKTSYWQQAKWKVLFHAGRMAQGPALAYVRKQFAFYARIALYTALEKSLHSIPKFMERAEEVNWLAARRYRPRPYPGPITLFRAETPDKKAEQLGDELGWGGFAEAGVEVHEIPGTHFDIIHEPNVQMLARKLSSCLARAYEEQRGRQFRLRPDGRASVSSTNANNAELFELEPLSTT